MTPPWSMPLPLAAQQKTQAPPGEGQDLGVFYTKCRGDADYCDDFYLDSSFFC
jgi:hypothetical protein